MPRPTSKGRINANQKYLKEWDAFQRDCKSKKPILLPVSVSIEDGVIRRDRIKSGDLAKVSKTLMKDFRHHCKYPDGYLEDAYCETDLQKMLDDYIKAFAADNSQSPTKDHKMPPSPLDFKICRPVWFLFYLPRDNWTFTDHTQFTVENDRDDFGRNFEKICTLDGNNYLLLANHCRSKPKSLKYNLHVTITQKIGRKKLRTDIIIDPGTENDTRGGDGGMGGGSTSIP